MDFWFDFIDHLVIFSIVYWITTILREAHFEKLCIDNYKM